MPSQLRSNKKICLIFLLLAPPSSIVMKGYPNNNDVIDHNSQLTLKSNDKYLTVRCVVYDSKPAVKFTWEFNGQKLDPKTNSAHCFNEENRPTFDCINGGSVPSEKDPSLMITSSFVYLKVGHQATNTLTCFAHHPASLSPQRVMVNINVDKSGKF